MPDLGAVSRQSLGSAQRTDLTQIGYSVETRRVLNELKDAGHINELVDGYRLAVAVACAFGFKPRLDKQEPRTTAYATATVDTPDLALRTAISEIFPDFRDVPYRAIEDLAEQGTAFLAKRLEGNYLSFSDLMDEVEAAQPGE